MVPDQGCSALTCKHVTLSSLPGSVSYKEPNGAYSLQNFVKFLWIMRSEKERKSKDAFRRLFTYPLLRQTEMQEEMKQEAMKLCASACENFPENNQNAAQLIKENMDKMFGGSWHAVVGEQFGLEISHEQGSLLYIFCGGNLAVCLWKCS